MIELILSFTDSFIRPGYQSGNHSVTRAVNRLLTYALINRPVTRSSILLFLCWIINLCTRHWNETWRTLLAASQIRTWVDKGWWPPPPRVWYNDRERAEISVTKTMETIKEMNHSYMYSKVYLSRRYSLKNQSLLKMQKVAKEYHLICICIAPILVLEQHYRMFRHTYTHSKNTRWCLQGVLKNASWIIK